jgi:parvulin-like peptidyl-prolyl isomerase
MSRSWAREPLLHFLLAGAAIFAVTALWPGGGDSHQINIDRQQLIDYMLARADITDRNQFDAVYGAMSTDARAALVRRVATDEALYREGLAIGLDTADPLIRQRIVQQMRQVLGDEAAAAQPLSDADLQAFYDKHRAYYAVGDTLSFAHVFFVDRVAAQAELVRLRAGKVSPEDAASHGQRFLYETFHRDVTLDAITAKFGAAFASAAFALQPGQWQGPLHSEHGWHLVFVTAHAPAHEPTMAELGDRLQEDALAARHEQAESAALSRVLEDYRVVTSGLPQ